MCPPNLRLHDLLYRRQPMAGDELYRQMCELLLSSQRTVVLTGAGISTGSGIPDFRSPDKGLWNRANPFQVASIWGFREDPQRFYDWIRPLGRQMLRARPNAAHLGVAGLERLGLVRTVITQNIDDLHQQAGSRRVLQLHGHTRSSSCLSCAAVVEGWVLWKQMMADPGVPRCRNCGGVLKPDVVLFGEELPASVLQEAQQAALNCDLMVVIGSSLEIMPAADLPLLARRRGARLAVLNLGHTMADHRADLVIRADVTVAVPRILALCSARLEADPARLASRTEE